MEMTPPGDGQPRPLLILGAQGQVGQEMVQAAKAAHRTVIALGREQGNLLSPESLRPVIAQAGWVINCAAYTAVDKAESDYETARQINGVAPGALAALCHAAAVPLVHLSTDYVFDGTGERPWREEDALSPVNAYGRSKAEGELAIQAALPQHLILRVSWVFGRHGANFVKTMLRLGQDRPELKIVGDQIGGPTPASDIAHTVLSMVAQAERPDFSDWGLYHYSGSPDVSWYGFAEEIFRQAKELGLKTPHLSAIATQDYPTPAKRPANSRMDCEKILRVFGINRPDWRNSLAVIFRDLHTP